MTPIINELVKLGQRKGPIWDKSGSGLATPRDLITRLADAKPFFIPNADGDLKRLCAEHPSYTSDSVGVFLPAPRCWIECGPMTSSDHPTPIRTAFLLDGSGGHIDGLLVMIMPNKRLVVVDTFVLRLAVDGGESSVDFSGWLPFDDTVSVGIRLELALLLINMPVGLKVEDQPAHKSNARSFARLGGVQPSVTYRTIHLDPFSASEKNSPGGATTSRRAFHFCRSHLRQRQTGALEVVRAHWRGDQALGHVESRYEISALGVH